MPMRSPLELFIVAALVTAAGGTSTYSSGGSNIAQLEPFRVASIPDILDNLDEYDKFWIEPSSPASEASGVGCVWSECGLDDTDDAYMGDNRDGDEQWYQYRTQSFCANAAYSLYGRKAEESNLFQGGWGGCTQRHFLNSFFTYGGADSLLRAVGVTPVSYYGDDDGGNDDGGDDDGGDDDGGDDDGGKDDDGNDDGYTSANANCVEIDYEEEDEDQAGDDEGEGDNSNDRRQLSSNSNDNDGYSSSLGCSGGGDYIMAVFKGSSCDGNYFVDALDTFDEYNQQHASVGCHKLWDAHKSASTDVVYKLLTNSWSCDVRLYPQGCPDPYGTKARYDDALRTAAHGGNPLRTYRSLIWSKRLRAVIPVLLALTAAILVVTYWTKNRKRIGTQGGGAKGCLRCVRDDAQTTTAACIASARAAAVGRLKKNKAKRAARKLGKKRGKPAVAAERDAGVTETVGGESGLVEMGVMT